MKVDLRNAVIEKYWPSISEYISAIKGSILIHQRLSVLEHISTDTLEVLDLFKTLSSYNVILLSTSTTNRIYILIEKVLEPNEEIISELKERIMSNGQYSLPSMEDIEDDFGNASVTESLVITITYYHFMTDELIIIGIPLKTIINCPKEALAS